MMRLALRLVVLIGLAGSGMGSSCSQEDGAQLQATIGTLAEARTKVESYGAILRERFPAASSEYRGGETRYADARAAFDGLIERLVFCIQTNLGASACDSATPERRAVESANQFVQYVQSLETDQAKIGAAVVAPIVIDVAMKVVDRMKGTSEADRKRTVEMLNALKVKPIQSLGAGS